MVATVLIWSPAVNASIPLSLPTQPLATASIRQVPLQLVPLTVAPDYTKEVLAPLYAAEAKAAADAEAARIAEAARLAEEARLAQEAAEVARAAAQRATWSQPARAVTFSGQLLGSYGYVSPWGNCVLEPGVNNPGWGNPIAWPIASQTPWIGATALWTYNHTGVVVGIWSNGDLEIRHQNFQGGQTRFSIWSFRGFR